MSIDHHVTHLCRDCYYLWQDQLKSIGLCPKCHHKRLISHPELTSLTIAHVDCDSFYASVEKRDNPEIEDKPVIIGGGRRGVVSAACYTARLFGVKSAMPMYQALKHCPDAVVIKPEMAKYKAVSQQIRAKFDALTPLVEPISMDEAFLDLSGTQTLHNQHAAVTLAKLAMEIEKEIGITVSIGLAPNKFLAKLGSDMDKPRGFTVIGRTDAVKILAELPIKRIYGVGNKTAARLARQGLTHIGQLQSISQKDLIQNYGEIGNRLYFLARGEDKRTIKASRPAKSVSNETTFSKDLWKQEDLERLLWSCCEQTSADVKRKKLAGQTVTLKLKTSRHRIITRSHTMTEPTQLAATLFEQGQFLLGPLLDGTAYRLIGIGLSHFRPLTEADTPTLLDPKKNKTAEAEKALDRIKEKFGKNAIKKGRSLPS